MTEEYPIEKFSTDEKLILILEASLRVAIHFIADATDNSYEFIEKNIFEQGWDYLRSLDSELLQEELTLSREVMTEEVLSIQQARKAAQN